MTERDGDADRNPVEVIAAEFVERLRHGEHPTIEEYASAHADIADEIRAVLPTVVQMEKLKVQKEASDSSRFLRGPGSLTRLGDFRIVSEIGRGGMGIVYEAEQQSLGRRVAVKVLPRQSLLDEHRLQRFEREAQTAARLHHTNIVPIFGVGEQDGYHYYVMQFIRGLGLDQVLRHLRGEKVRTSPGSSGSSLSSVAAAAASALRNGRPGAPDPETTQPADATEPVSEGHVEPTSPPAGAKLYWSNVARIGQQVADALSYAHAQGTLHRDIKPANLLLDGEGIVWITDFGLAKAIEDDNITHSGDVVGTLQYMAPEQFCGAYDERSDIYCLGLTLYELLTLRPAFDGSNRSGLMHRVTEGRPTAPRRRRPEIPADLETIVLKAIRREPEHRYQTAGELRDDLQRFLDDRPIRARRLNPLQVFGRWCQRNRALAGAIAIAVIAVLTATVIGWNFYFYESQKAAEAREAKTLSDNNLGLSLEAFEQIFDRLAGTDLFQAVIHTSTAAAARTDTETDSDPAGADEQSVSIPVVSEKDARLLKDILAFWDEFARQNDAHPTLQVDSARAHFRVGNIHLRLGEYKAARTAYIKAIMRFQALPGDAHVVTVARIRNQLGQLYAEQQEVEAARESHELVLAALEENGQPKKDTNVWLYELARAHDFLGSWGSRTWEPGRRRRGRHPWDPWRRRFHELHRDRYSTAQRRAHHERAQELLAELLQREPTHRTFLLAMARSCRNYSSLLARERRPSSDRRRASELRDQAIGILTTLSTRFPKQPQYRYELAETLAARRRGPPSVDDLESALTLLRELHESYPTMPSYTAGLSRLLHILAVERFAAQRFPQGEAEIRESIELMEDLVRRRPDNAAYLRNLARTRMPYVDALRQRRDLGNAQTQLESSLKEWETYLKKTRRKRDGDRELRMRYDRLASLLYRTGQPDAARTLLERKPAR